LDSTDIVEASEGYESACVLVASNTKTQTKCIMDSGCSYHSSLRKDYFETLKLKLAGALLLGNNYPCKVQGIGTVRLKMFDNREYLLKDVRYILELKRNLISINMFDDLGYSTRILNGVLKISNGSLIIAKGNKNKSNGLFILEGSTIIGHASIASNTLIDKTKLWHLRLGHVSERGLHELEKKKFVRW